MQGRKHRHESFTSHLSVLQSPRAGPAAEARKQMWIQASEVLHKGI